MDSALFDLVSCFVILEVAMSAAGFADGSLRKKYGYGFFTTRAWGHLYSVLGFLVAAGSLWKLISMGVR